MKQDNTNWLDRIFSYPLCNFHMFKWANTPLKSREELEKEAEELLNSDKGEYFIDYGDGGVIEVTKEKYDKVSFESILMFSECKSLETLTSSTLIYHNRIIG